MHRVSSGGLMQRVAILVTLSICVLAVGCHFGDPVRRVEQSVVLRVSSLAEAASPPSASIAIREFYLPSKRDEEFARFNPKHFEQMYPWTQAVKTDESGRATIVYGVSMLDGSTGNVPPASRYPLEGHTFTVRVTGSDGETDVVQLEMSEGTSAEGRKHRITVEGFTDAVYVDPN